MTRAAISTRLYNPEMSRRRQENHGLKGRSLGNAAIEGPHRPRHRRVVRRHQPRGAIGDDRPSLCRFFQQILETAVRRRASCPNALCAPKTTSGCLNFGTASRTSWRVRRPGSIRYGRRNMSRASQGLKRKVRRWKPPIVAFVGVTLFRSIFDIPSATASCAWSATARALRGRACVSCSQIRAAGTRISRTRKCSRRSFGSGPF